MKVEFIKQKRKTISIKVDENNLVTVKYPNYVKLDYAKDFFNKKQKWINAQIEKNNLQNEFYILVKNKKFAYLYGEKIPYTNNFKSIYETESLKLIERVKYYKEKYNFTVNSVSLKNYSSRWGCCDKNKNITLNKKLVFLDYKTIDYVIIHELCHTIYMNHKTEFHKLLSSLTSNEKNIKENLKKMNFLLKIKY